MTFGLLHPNSNYAKLIHARAKIERLTRESRSAAFELEEKDEKIKILQAKVTSLEKSIEELINPVLESPKDVQTKDLQGQHHALNEAKKDNQLLRQISVIQKTQIENLKEELTEQRGELEELVYEAEKEAGRFKQMRKYLIELYPQVKEQLPDTWTRDD